MAFTVLRDNRYADFLPSMVGADGVLRGPAGQRLAAVVALDDVAEPPFRRFRGGEHGAGRR